MSSAPAKFDLLTTPLERGTSLLEASAGTGKTYAIAGLFTRMVLEGGLSVDQILTVTYTEAATAELRQRVRKMLADVLKVFSGDPTEDAFLAHLVTAHAHEKSDMIARLERALACFDQAAIFTIHGFCQRTLQDRAFESGVLFDVELITDQSPILREIADDYWRKHFYEPGPVSFRFTLKNKLSPDVLLKFFRQCINHPFLKFHSRVTGQSTEVLQRNLEKIFAEARDEWKREASTIRAFFGSQTTWGNEPYNNDDKMSECFEQLECCFAQAEPDEEALDVLDSFCTKTIREKIAKKAKSPAPAHRFFELCDQLAEAEADFLSGVWLDFVRFAQVELPKRKARGKVQSFDDLLMNVYRVLQSAAGPALVGKLRATYQAALIDEFQDTDPVQYEIFRRIFADGDAYLYLIGDPKQAIYAFRGADIFTYMQAADEAARHYTLDQNWRSEAKLVAAVNTIFDRTQNPFVFEQIQFAPVVAKANADKKPFAINGQRPPPFQLWFCEPEGKSIPKNEAEKQIPETVASEIVRLLDGNTRIGERALRPEDIAVLVPENKHAQLMQDALRAVNVPSVLHTTASLFGSFEAAEFVRVLTAITRPTDDRLLKAALATELMGFSGTRLAALNETETQVILERFHDYLALWTDHGFFRMFRQWLQHESVRRRLLAYADGERRLTNVLHLGEVLHGAESEFRYGATGLLQWLGERMDSGDETSEEHQLRLERDDNAVRLITIHKSKGLQYGVVFCPFNWRGSDPARGEGQEIFFHDPDHPSQLSCDIGSRDYAAHLQIAGRERLAENVRLMYVAVTRAVHRCYFTWGKFKSAGTSAAAWLFHPPSAEETDLAQLGEQFEALSSDEMHSQLKGLADASAGAIDIEDMPPASPGNYQPPDIAGQALSCREFTGKIQRDWRIASFSLLASARAEELPDYDDVAAPVVETEEASGIFAFPRGVRAGTCLHKMLQLVDLANTRQGGPAIIEERLRDYGLFDREHQAAVTTMLENVVHTPLLAAQRNFVLSRVLKNERLNELEFYFPISQVALPELFQYFSDTPGVRPIHSGNFILDPLNGFLKGFIDVVFRLDGKFYLADWKSNWLGNRVEDYHPAALQAEMKRHQYRLQYHLYTVALHKYLALRLPGYEFDTHFGGVFYIFLRGLDPARPRYGILHDRPSAERIEHLGKILGTA